MATRGGWLLYFVDLSGYGFLGDYWPLADTIGVLGVTFLILLVLGYIARTVQAPVIIVQLLAALLPWDRAWEGGTPVAEGSVGPTRRRCMGPDVDRLPETVFYPEFDSNASLTSCCCAPECPRAARCHRPELRQPRWVEAHQRRTSPQLELPTPPAPHREPRDRAHPSMPPPQMPGRGHAPLWGLRRH